MAIEIIGKLIVYLSKIISSSLKLFPWVADKYSVWREGGGPGVGSPDEDIPNGSKQPQDFIECAGALWKPYINLDKEEVYIPHFLHSKVGPFCKTCKREVTKEGRSLLKPFLKWRCSANHTQKIPTYFSDDLFNKIKAEFRWKIKNS